MAVAMRAAEILDTAVKCVSSQRRNSVPPSLGNSSSTLYSGTPVRPHFTGTSGKCPPSYYLLKESNMMFAYPV
jgi:hypothetical protein